MDHILEDENELAVPLDEVFEFFADAGNLETLTPPALQFHILTPRPIAMHVGALIEYRLRLLRLPFGWTTRIAEWNPPHRFVDEQLKGPYALWEHTHTFTSTDGGTLVHDRVRYRLPFSPFGDLAFPLVRFQLGRIFAYRRKAMIAALDLAK